MLWLKKNPNYNTFISYSLYAHPRSVGNYSTLFTDTLFTQALPGVIKEGTREFRRLIILVMKCSAWKQHRSLSLIIHHLELIHSLPSCTPSTTRPGSTILLCAQNEGGGRFKMHGDQH